MAQHELSEIKHIRNRVGLSQHELAELSDVSQSLVAKIESGRIDPSFTNAKKIFSALDRLQKDKEIKVESIMNNRIISLSPKDSAKKAIEEMKRYKISQLPVISRGYVLGTVSETVILDSIMSKKNISQIEDIMDDAPPIVAKDTPVSVASNLLRHFPMVLVSSKGRLIGVVTKSDILGIMAKQ